MLKDLVVDTNVLGHANNPGVSMSAISRQLLARLLTVATTIGVDPGISWPATSSTSRLWCEYRDTGVFRYGSVAFHFMAAMLRARRVHEIPPAKIRAHDLRGMVAPGRDSLVVKIAVATREKIVITHDPGFDTKKLQSRHNVRVRDAASCLPML